MPLALQPYPLQIIDMEVDPERGWILRRPLAPDHAIVPALVDDAGNRNRDAAEPAPHVSGRAMGRGVDPELTSSIGQHFHEVPGTLAHRFGIPQPPPAGHEPLRGNVAGADDRAIEVEGDPHPAPFPGRC